MKTIILLMGLTFCSVSLAGPAGHGHSHGQNLPAISEKNAQETGYLHVKRLIEAKKLEASWAEAKFDKSEKKQFGEKTEWVVTFKNENGVKGKVLYVFLKLSGEFVAANFTGK